MDDTGIYGMHWEAVKDVPIFKLVYKEHLHQLDKWGKQDHEPSEWMLFAAEEFGETAQAIAEWEHRAGLASKVVKEAIQTATLMLKIAQMFQYESDLEEKITLEDQQ